MKTPFIKRLGYYALYPFYGYLNARFRDVIEHLVNLQNKSDRIADLQLQLTAARHEIAHLRELSRADTFVVNESFGYIDRSCRNIEADCQDIHEDCRDIHKTQQELSDRIDALSQLITPPGNLINKETPAELSEEEANFMNRATSYMGFAAKASLWFNPPTVLQYKKGEVVLNQLHERIVEVPFAFSGLAGLKPGAHVLDVGSHESTLAISLAMLGFRVTALDLRAYPFQHPNLTDVACDIQSWDGPGQPLDAVFCISALEHFGIEYYGNHDKRPDLDAWTLQQFHRWLNKDGILTLTVPYGVPHVTPTERVYGPEFIESLQKNWDILEQHIYIQTEPTQWTPVEGTAIQPDWVADTRGVLLLRAKKR